MISLMITIKNICIKTGPITGMSSLTYDWNFSPNWVVRWGLTLLKPWTELGLFKPISRQKMPTKTDWRTFAVYFADFTQCNIRTLWNWLKLFVNKNWVFYYKSKIIVQLSFSKFNSVSLRHYTSSTKKGSVNLNPYNWSWDSF